jgi:hypothetical protein
MPWEREIYILLIKEFIEEENSRLSHQQKGM